MTAEVQRAPRHIQRKWCPELGRHAVHSRDLARVIAHKHFNLMDALRLTIGDAPRVADHVHWAQYVAANNRIHPAALLSSMAVAAVGTRLHNVPGCRDVRARLEAISQALALADEQRRGAMPVAEPAPDEEIKPPLEEPPGLFDKVEPAGGGLPSWRINALIQELTTGAGLPRYLGQDLLKWNKSRQDALWDDAYRRGAWDEFGRIFNSREPEAE